MPRLKPFALHGLGLCGLLVLAAAIATYRGALWPFDIRATLLMTGAGLATVLSAWAPLWLLVGGVSALLDRPGHRAALWLITVWTAIVLHAAIGPLLGFAPLPVLGIGGLIALYLVPAGLAVLTGSALHPALPRRRRRLFA
jgi:hypothetical protein